MSSNITTEKSEPKGSEKKPLISTFTAILIGGFAVYEIDKRFFAENRYPVAVEYEVVEACVNAGHSALTVAQQKRKKEICTCALVKTQVDIPYKDMKKDGKNFFSRLKEETSSC
ncbi:MAG: hypothetical protein ACTJHW_10465 [Paenalcaligenes sp.]